MGRGWFITFEGGEGTGKSTQIDRLRRHLEKRRFAVLVSHEPGGTPLAEGIRGLLLDPAHSPDALTELFLLEASRRVHVQEVIRPALARGEVVLCDRFVDSSLVYQGWVGGVDEELVAELNRAATDGVTPDLTIVFDLAHDEGRRRARSRNRANGGASRIDDNPPEFHRRVREGFLELARREPGRVRVVDAAGEPGEVFHRLLAELPEELR